RSVHSCVQGRRTSHLHTLSLHDALPISLHEDELEYQEGWKERRARLERQFRVSPPLTFGNGNGNGHQGARAAKAGRGAGRADERSEEHTSELQSRFDLVCRLPLEKQNTS